MDAIGPWLRLAANDGARFLRSLNQTLSQPGHVLAFVPIALLCTPCRIPPEKRDDPAQAYTDTPERAQARIVLFPFASRFGRCGPASNPSSGRFPRGRECVE